MIVVIQCAGKKRSEAGCLRDGDGRKVLFVADPAKAPSGTSYRYARPDDISDVGTSWRAALLRYNDAPGNNPLGLLPAWQLYENPIYGILADRFGVERLYILSAGWGLIPGNFLTPKYDITFKRIKDQVHTRRLPSDRYDDLKRLTADTDGPILFFVSKGYVPLACELTKGIKEPKYLFYNSNTAPPAPGCVLRKYETTTRTNWQYECAKAFVRGEIGIR